MKLQNTSIYSFANGYQWYILPVKEEKLTIRCPQALVTTVVINKVSILTLESHCKATTDTDAFFPATHNSKDHSIEENQMLFNLSLLTATFINDSHVPLPVFHSTQIDLSQLRASYLSLSEAEKEYEEMLHTRRQHSWWQKEATWLEQLGYTSLAILIFAGFWKTIYRTRDYTVIYHHPAVSTVQASYQAPVDEPFVRVKNSTKKT